MSWFINAIGTPTAVKDAVQKNGTLSPALKAAFVEICDDKPYDGMIQDGLQIEGSGHGVQGSYINSLKVVRFQLAKEPVPAATNVTTAASP